MIMNADFYKLAASLQEKLRFFGDCFVKVHKNLRKFRPVYLSDHYFYVISQEKVKLKISLLKILKLIVSNNSAEIVIVLEGKSVLVDHLKFRSVFMKQMSAIDPGLQIIYVKEPVLDQYVERQKEDTKQEQCILNLVQIRQQFIDYSQNAFKKTFDQEFKYQEFVLKDEYYSILTISETKNREQARKKKKIKQQLKKYTVKIYPKQPIGQNQVLLKQILNEKKYLQDIMSPYVPTLYKCMISKTYVYCITEYYKGQTLQCYLKNETLNKNTLKLLLGQIVIALGQIHQCNLVYNSVNTKGIFVNDRGFILLNDLSKCEPVEQRVQQIFQPEIKILQKKSSLKPSFSNDWKQFGELIYFIKEGRQWEQKVPIIQYKEKQLSNLIRRLLQKNVEQRLGFRNDYHEIFGHDYFKGLNSKQLATQSCEPIKKFFKVNHSIFSKQDFNSFLAKQDWSLHDAYLKDYQYSRQLQE